MHAYIVYAHPSSESFTHKVLKSFVAGLKTAGHTCEIHDLYKTRFQAELDIGQYDREMSLFPSTQLPADVRNEQEKIQNSDAIVFVYPVWWSDCPAILKGWFDRVWSNGFAYSYDSGKRKSLVKPEKALAICTAGHTIEHLEQTGIARSMKCIMIEDRLNNVGVLNAKMIILGGMTARDPMISEGNLLQANAAGLNLGKDS